MHISRSLVLCAAVAFVSAGCEVHDAERDRVVCRNRWHGTNTKTGRKIEFHGFVEWRFEGDRIAERWATVTSPTEVD